MNSDRLIQGFAILLIVYLHLSPQLLLILPQCFFPGPGAPPMGAAAILAWTLVLVLMNLSIAMLYYHYYLACATSPGRVPRGWSPEQDYEQRLKQLHPHAKQPGRRCDDAESGHDGAACQQSERYNELMKQPIVIGIKQSAAAAKDSGGSEGEMNITQTYYRYCTKCQHYKPLRCHHCSHCQTCTLRMDHHCPWIGTCVGCFNQAPFCRFLVWTQLSTLLYLAVTLVVLSQHPADSESPGSSPWHQASFVLGGILNALLYLVILLAVALVLSQQLYHIARGRTFIEGLECKMLAAQYQRLLKLRDPHALLWRARISIFPFDLGSARANFAGLFGPHLWGLLWAPRWAAGRSDGLHFALNPKLKPGDVVEWPPRLEDLYAPPATTGPERPQRGDRAHARTDSEGYIIPGAV